MTIRSVARARAGAALLIALFVSTAVAALPRFGDTLEAGGLSWLRDSEDPHLYHALPAHPRLATDAGGKPRFSFMEFSFRGDGGEGPSGALLNFMLTWGLDAAGQEKAEQALRQVDPEARVAGTLLVREGRYRVIVKNGDDRFVLAEGEASVMPGQPIAFSRRLETAEADRLRAALDSDEGHVAAGFLLTVTALGPRVSARCTIDWDAVLASREVGALGAGGPHPEAAVRAAFDALVSSGTIVVEVMGEQLEPAFDEVYRSFRAAAFESAIGAAAGGDAVEVQYVRSEARHTGRVILMFDGSESESRDLFIAGDLTEAIRGAIADAAKPVSAP
jgi:hypothetical protein